MKRHIIFAILLATVLSAQGYDSRKAEVSSMTLAGISPICRVPEVQLLDEQVQLTVQGIYTEVSVRYQLHNTSSKELADIPCGFAVNYYGSGPVRLARTNFWYNDALMREAGWSDAYVKDVHFALDGSALRWHCPTDSLLSPARPLTNLPFSEEMTDSLYRAGIDADEMQFNLMLEAVGGSEGNYMERFFILENGLSRRQYLTHISLRSGQTAVFSVRYRIYNRRTVSYTDNNTFYQVIDDGSFEYSFAQDAGWGDGRAKHLSVRVEMPDKYIKRAVYWGDTNDPNSSKSAVTTFSYDDYDLAAGQTVRLSYSTRPALLWNDFMARRINPAKYRLILSCEDAKYPPSNLSDRNLKTTAVLYPNGKGRSYINILFDEPTHVTGVMLLGGYGKDSASWYNNSRVRKIRMVVIGADGQPDRSYAWDVDYIPFVQEPKGFSPDLLTPAAIKIPIAKDYSAPSMPMDEDKRVSEIRLQIMDIAPGLKSDDLCISEIILLN